MTKRERVLTVLNGGVPDKLPWFGDLDYWVSYLRQDQLYDEKYKVPEGIFQLHRDMDVGFYLQGFFPYKSFHEGVTVRREKIDGVSIMTYETPHGTLTEKWKAVPQTYSSAPVEHLIKSVDDLSALRYLYENTYYEKDYQRISFVREMAGDNGISLCYIPKSPFMEMAALKAGIETLTYCLADDEDETEATFEVMSASNEKAAKLVIASDCECIMIPENLSSECVGPHYFGRYIEPYLRKWAAEIKASHKFSFVHMDGTLRGLLGQMAQTGLTVLEALTPAPAGDMPIDHVLETVPPDVIVWGGLPGALFDDSTSSADFDAFTIDVIQKMVRRGNCVLGVADQVPPKTSRERLKRVNELVETYGSCR